MPKRLNQPPKTPVDAVQQVYTALEPFDDQARKRIIDSVVSLLGMRSGVVALDANRRSPQPMMVPPPGQPERAEPGRPLSPRELIQEKQPTTNAQKIAVFAYYREKVEGLSRFSRNDLEAYFAKAKEPPPGNYHRDFQAAVSLGWIYEDGTDSYLTTKGLEAVEGGFGGKAQLRGVSAGKRPRRKRSKSKASNNRKQKRS